MSHTRLARRSRIGIALTAFLAGTAIGTVCMVPVAEAKYPYYRLPPRVEPRQHPGGLPQSFAFLARQPMEANPFRTDSSTDHGPRRYSGSRLYVPTPDWER